MPTQCQCTRQELCFQEQAEESEGKSTQAVSKQPGLLFPFAFAICVTLGKSSHLSGSHCHLYTGDESSHPGDPTEVL